jgi:hypothetical protein
MSLIQAEHVNVHVLLVWALADHQGYPRTGIRSAKEQRVNNTTRRYRGVKDLHYALDIAQGNNGRLWGYTLDADHLTGREHARRRGTVSRVDERSGRPGVQGVERIVVGEEIPVAAEVEGVGAGVAMVRIAGVGVRDGDALALRRTDRLRWKLPGLATSGGIKRLIAGFATGHVYLGL